MARNRNRTTDSDTIDEAVQTPAPESAEPAIAEPAVEVSPFVPTEPEATPPAPVVPKPRPLPAAPPAAAAVTPRFRVRLPGVKVRQVDSEGRPSYSDYLEVEATNEGEAWMKFKAHNGILSSTQQPEISRLAD